jgi:hypothetical protein
LRTIEFKGRSGMPLDFQPKMCVCVCKCVCVCVREREKEREREKVSE